MFTETMQTNQGGRVRFLRHYFKGLHFDIKRILYFRVRKASDSTVLYSLKVLTSNLYIIVITTLTILLSSVMIMSYLYFNNATGNCIYLLDYSLIWIT